MPWKMAALLKISVSNSRLPAYPFCMLCTSSLTHEYSHGTSVFEVSIEDPDVWHLPSHATLLYDTLQMES